MLKIQIFKSEAEERLEAEELVDSLKQKNMEFQELLNDLTLRIEDGDETQSKLMEANRKLDVNLHV